MLEKVSVSAALPLEVALPASVIRSSNQESSYADHSAPSYQISAQSHNTPVSYHVLTIFNLGVVRHLGFDEKWILTFNYSTTSADHMHQRTNYQHSRTMLC